MTVHWLVNYSLDSFPDINWWGEVLSLIICLKEKRSTDMSDRVRDRARVSRFAICNLWSILAEGARIRAKWGRPPCPLPHLHPPLPFSTFFLVSAPPSSRGWLGQPWGENMLESRQTIFRLTAFTFGPSRASWKQTDKTKDSKLMTRVLQPNPNPWQLTPDLARPYSSPPLLPLLSWLLIPSKSCMHSHTYLDTDTLTHTHITTTITLYLNSVTCGIWFRLSQEERDRDTQRERVSVSVRERKGLSVCVWTFIIMC